jgi:hypothetical protein
MSLRVITLIENFCLCDVSHKEFLHAIYNIAPKFSYLQQRLYCLHPFLLFFHFPLSFLFSLSLPPLPFLAFSVSFDFYCINKKIMCL